MSKLILVCVSVLTFLSATSFAQSGTDPLHWTAPVHVKSNNIFMLWSQQNSSGSETTSFQKVLRYEMKKDSLPPADRLQETQVHQSSSVPVSGNQQMDVASGYFTNSVFEDVVAAWEGPNGTIQIMIPHFDSTANAWSVASELTVPGPVVSGTSGQNGRIYVRTGDFLGNGRDQFVLAYEGADSTIHLQVYSVDSSLVPHLVASIHDERLLPTPTGLAQFSITTGDLNGNGKDEIILDGVEQDYNGKSDWAVYARVYEVNGSSIIPEARTIIFREPVSYFVQTPDFGITAGQFRKDGEDQIAFVLAENQYSGSNAYVFINILQASKDLNTLTYDPSKRDSVEIGTSGDLTDFSIASGDLNNGGRDELVFDLNDIIYVYSVDDSLNITYRLTLGGLSGGGSSDSYLSSDFLKVGDLNEDGFGNIVVEKDIYGNGTDQWMELNAYAVSQNLSSDSLLATISTDTSAATGASQYYHYALALGTFNGADFTLGKPLHYVKNNVVQPLVVLNTPPIHFDILNGTKYDLANCFSGNGCSFYSTYEQKSATTTNLQTVTHNDVSDAAGVDLSGNVAIGVTESAEFLGAGAQVSETVATNFEAKVEKTWGHSFATEKSATQTTQLDIGVSAKGDDQIYATTTSYNLWVYPVYEGNASQPVDYLNFASPISTLGAWYPSQTYATTNYIPNHEVGNILSYLPPDSAMHNPNIDSSIVSVSQSQGLPISGQSGSYWDLSYSKYRQSSLDSTWNSGWDTNIDLGAAYSSKGDNARMTTSTTTIMNGFDLRATFGSLVDSLGNEAAYTVYPYAYRSKQGAIVINYAVSPVLGGSGSPSWWQNEYGRYSDPTFILPWFYDPQKGIALSFPAKRYQTSDISFSNNSPQPGDTVTITARVRNFSLVATPIPVTVKFYVGDPDSGGTLITGINGADSAMTAGPVKARYWSDAAIRWVVPSGLQKNPRIYAVIDPSNRIHEVHENNNMGFNVLGQQSLTGIAQSPKPEIPKSPVLNQSYPNPFNPTARITFAIPKLSLVTITVYNILGQRVATLVSGVESAGNHSVTFDGARYASGVYFYRMSVRSLSGRQVSYSKTMKMMLLK